jgi:hypothetical protein
VGVQLSVPLVCAVLDVKDAPAVIAVPDAVRDAIASPSGSAALTVKDPGTFSPKVAVAGAVTTGARSAPLVTVIAVVAEPERPLTAVNVTESEPAAAGVQVKVPEVFDALTVNVPPAVIADPDAVSEVIVPPSGSAAVTVNVRSCPIVPVTADGAVTTGGRSMWITVMLVVAVPDRAFDAVNVTE